MSLETKIKIENFGPIKNAKINNSNLTVLIGPNSSGKSFTALLIHALLNPLGEKSKNFSNRILDLSLKAYEELTKNNSPTYTEFHEKLKEYIEKSPNYLKYPFKINKNNFKTLIDEGVGVIYKNLIEEKIKELFEVDNLDKLINFNSDFFKIEFNNMKLIKEKNKEFYIENLFSMNKISYNITYETNNHTDSFFRLENNGEYYNLFLNYLLFENDGKFEINRLISMVYSFVANSIFENLFKDFSYYIPSARDELLKNKNSYLSQNLRGEFSFSSTQTELASNLLDIIPESKNGDFNDIANRLEEDILKGVVDMKYIEPNTDVYYKNKDEISLPFNLVSSAIRELSPFILYLKYILKKGDTLVIEEPEAHLHPANQRKLVKYFVEAINKGLNIIITTHSDYISDQINNHIRLNNIPSNTLKEEFDVEYSILDILNYEKINIYNFKHQHSEFITEEIEIYPTGFIEDNFSNVSSELYAETVKIIDSEEE